MMYRVCIIRLGLTGDTFYDFYDFDDEYEATTFMDTNLGKSDVISTEMRAL